MFTFYFTLFSDRFSEVLDSCTVQRYQMVDGSTSEALQARVQYRRYQWLMGALLKRSRPVNSTWRCSPFYVQYRRRSLYCVLYMEHHIHQQKEIHLIPLIPSYSLLKPLILGVRKE